MDVIVGLAAVVGLAAIVAWFVLNRWDGGPGSGEIAPGNVEGSDFLVRSYRGRQQSEAVARYVTDAEALAQRGYVPVGQSWGDGQWDGGYFLLGLVLFRCSGSA